MIYNGPVNIEDDVRKNDIIKEFHDSSHSGGHTGVKRTINKIKQRYIWKNLNKMVKHYINSCKVCAKNKQIKHTKEKMVITNTPTTSFETISIDTVGPLRPINNFRYILTIQCELTKYIEAISLENKEANAIAKALVEQFILKYGSFKTLKTDLGTEFVNELFKNICSFFDINHVTSTPYHHETLGSIERNHRVLNEYLLSFVEDFNWDKWIPYYVFSYNTTSHTDTDISPYELVFGKLACLPTDKKLAYDKPIYNLDNYAEELRFRLQEARKKAKILLDLAKTKRKQLHDKTTNTLKVSIGDFVWLKVIVKN